MFHTDALAKFKEIYHFKDEDIDAWWPNGRNSIRVRFKNKIELVFTWRSETKWKIESLDQFIDSISVRKV